MIAKSIIFVLIAYGFAFVISFVVALIIKGIALVVQRGEKSATADNVKK